MLPEGGHFLIYMHYHKKWMCAVIDGSTGYLVGYITRSSGQDIRVQENSERSSSGKGKSKGSREQMKERQLKGSYIEGAEKLPWSGCYVDPDECELSYRCFVNSFCTMYKRVERIVPAPTKEEVIVSGDTMTLFLPESGRSDRLRRMADRKFLRGFIVGLGLADDARNWSGRTIQALGRMRDITPSKWEGKKGGQELYSFSDKCFGPELKEEMEIIEDIRLFYRIKPLSPKFYLADMPVHLNWKGPVADGSDILKKSCSEVNELSKFLIQPFLQFNRSEPANASQDERPDEVPDRGVITMHQALPDEVENHMTFQEDKEHSFTEAQWNNDNFQITMMEEVTEEVGNLDFTSLDNDLGPYEAPMVSEQQTRGYQGSAGIHNSGNICYANSGLQFLHCVPDFKRVLDRSYLRSFLNFSFTNTVCL
jgi:hypothetical protein